MKVIQQFTGVTVSEGKAKEVNYDYVKFVLETFKVPYNEIVGYSVKKSLSRWLIKIDYI